MAHPSSGHGSTQNGGDVVLDQQISETLRTVASGEGDGHDSRER
jgi:hypothetical protein